MDDFDFRRIVPLRGGQREAFEELCCQLARRTPPEDATFSRLWGAGGDGGVECYADLPDGSRVGWQAKYVFDVDSLIVQATRSLTTALRIHVTLTRYVVCFPIDLTGPTGRRGRNGVEKFDEWRKKYEGEAAAEGRQLTIEVWPASRIRSLLLDLDTAGGIREFFFNATILTEDWFSAHLDSTRVIAGPRYTPKLNVETELWKWFAAFGRTSAWSHALEKKIHPCREAHGHLSSAVLKTNSDPMSPAWPDDSREEAQATIAKMVTILDESGDLSKTSEPEAHSHLISQLNDLLEGLASIESQLADDLEARHGAGRVDSPGFRQFMAEYEVSFPAANLDYARDAINRLRDLRDWLQSPECSLAFARAFVLTGAAGVGKTHGVCDAADHRFSDGFLTCVTFGHMFRGEPDPWTRLLESLALPPTLGRDGLLDALNAAAEASGSLLILGIDAINETRPLRYWRDRLAAFVEAVRQRPNLRLCVTCRSSFLPHCLPEDHGLPVIEHAGFAGFERDACEAFFRAYGLRPPIAPILQPELSNPLYLKLACETLRSLGQDRLPSGWFGLAPVIKAFLGEKERQFAKEYETTAGANIVGGSLGAIARAIANSDDPMISFSDAQRVIVQARPLASRVPVLDWLVRADLLIEDALRADDPLGDESSVRPAFDRLGDFLIAAELLDKVTATGLATAFRSGGSLHRLLADPEAVDVNSRTLSALSILVSEQMPGTELPDLTDDESVRGSLTELTVESIPWRDPASFSLASRSLILEALGRKGSAWTAMDAVLSISWMSSAIDAIWLDRVLKGRPLANRDAWWCGYLHNRYESRGPARRLIEAAFELPLDQVEVDVAERWATALLWFTAAADRRVKDRATRAAVALLSATPDVIPSVLTRLLECDDDEVRERTLLSCYSALIASRDTELLRRIIDSLHAAFRNSPLAFDNALIRDNIRSIATLAGALGALPDGCDPELTLEPTGSAWPLELPSREQIERWVDLPKLAQSCLDDDFLIYSMDRLRPWEHAVPKGDMGKWVLNRVADDFGYEGSGSEQYDGFMLGKYGGGRGKPTWAERIGKKYQWIAMSQLASRLHDHVERKSESWESDPQGTPPPILLEGRKFDPTLPPNMIGQDGDAEAWWIRSSADLRSSEELTDAEWVTRKGGLPTLEELLSPTERDGQRWRLLTAYSSWNTRDRDADWQDTYRDVWVRVEAYLVHKQDIQRAYNSLERRNFFGRWMPAGATYLYGFAGEYPWASPFNIEDDELETGGRLGKDLPVTYLPCWNDLAVEWEYDASIQHNFMMHLPARSLFTPGDLWWDGRDGYRLANGRTVFRDPSVTEAGPGALLADVDDLSERLDKLGVRLLWTLLGEKWILGGSHDKVTPRRTFSQVALLEDDGSVQIGERVFFEDYKQDAGPLPI